MKVWKSILTLLLLALWLPATVHCGLESVGFIPMDECCETETSGAPHSESACKIVEGSSFKTECAATLPAPPETLAILTELSLISLPLAPDEIDVTQSEFLTHHLPQFFIQRAVPIRGPSRAS